MQRPILDELIVITDSEDSVNGALNSGQNGDNEEELQISDDYEVNKSNEAREEMFVADEHTHSDVEPSSTSCSDECIIVE